MTQLAFEKFRLTKLQVLPSRPKSTKGFPFEFEIGRTMVHEMGSSIEGFGNPSTHTSTPKSVEEVAIEVMKANKVVELFQNMVIVSLNMGNLTLEVKTLKNILTTWEREKGNVIGGIG